MLVPFGPAMPLLETHPREIHICAKTRALIEASIWSTAHKPPAGLGSDWGRGNEGVTVVASPASGRSPHSDALPGDTCMAGRLLEAHVASTLECGHFTHHTPRGPVLPTRLPAPGLSCVLHFSASKLRGSVRPLTWLGGCTHPSPLEVETTGPASPLLGNHSPLSITFARSRGRLRLVIQLPRHPFREGSLEGVRLQHPLLLDTHPGQGEPHPAARYRSNAVLTTPHEEGI